VILKAPENDPALAGAVLGYVSNDPEAREIFLPYARSLLHYDHEWVREGALVALSRIGDSSDMLSVRSMIYDPSDRVRFITIRVLRERGTAIDADLLNSWLLGNGSSASAESRTAAQAAIQAIRTKEAMAAMNAAMARSQHRTEILKYISGIGISVFLICTPLWYRLIVRHIQTRRAIAGHCIWCGYDLRGTPNRCPECGKFKSTGKCVGNGG
jgi:hypothetical protein